MKIELIKFEQVAFNLKNQSANLQYLHLSIISKTLKIQSLQLQGTPAAQSMLTNIDDLRNLLTVRISKLHEYTATQIIELENIAKLCFHKKAGKNCWEELKVNLQNQASAIFIRTPLILRTNLQYNE